MSFADEDKQPASTSTVTPMDGPTLLLSASVLVAVACNYVHMRRSPSGAADTLLNACTVAYPTAAHDSREIFDAVDEGNRERLVDLLAAHKMGQRESGLDWVNGIGRTALIQACVRQRPGLARLLLEAGADSSLVAAGRSALDWARMWSAMVESESDDAAVALALMEAHRRRADARRRWRVHAKAVGAMALLWAQTKEARYAPGGPGYTAALLDFHFSTELVTSRMGA